MGSCRKTLRSQKTEKNGEVLSVDIADKLKVLKGGLYTQLSFHTNEAANALSIVDIKNVEREELLIL